jgi:hypothetical protein
VEDEPFRFTKEGDRYFARVSPRTTRGPRYGAVRSPSTRVDHGAKVNVSFLWELEEEIGSPPSRTGIRAEAAALKTDAVVVSDTVWISRKRPACLGPARPAGPRAAAARPAPPISTRGPRAGAARNPIAELMAVVCACFDPRTGRVKIPGFYEDVEPLSRADAGGFRNRAFRGAEFKKDHQFKSLRVNDRLEVMKRIWAMPTFEIHGVVGGYQGPGVKTIIPPRGEVKVTCRLVPNQDPKKIVKLIQSFVRKQNKDVVVELEGTLAPYKGATQGVFADAIRSSMKFAFGKEPVFVREGGSHRRGRHHGAGPALSRRLPRPVAARAWLPRAERETTTGSRPPAASPRSRDSAGVRGSSIASRSAWCPGQTRRRRSPSEGPRPARQAAILTTNPHPLTSRPIRRTAFTPRTRNHRGGSMSEEKHRPFVPESVQMPEFTISAVVLGLVMTVVLGAANAYLGLRAGMTIAATYPARVISMFVLRPQARSILEENLARTAGSIGESVAAGAVFTLPAFVIAHAWPSFDFKDAYWKSTCLMIVGSVLGVLFVSLVRRAMVEDRTLPFPESVAAGEIHKAGQRGAQAAKHLFWNMASARWCICSALQAVRRRARTTSSIWASSERARCGSADRRRPTRSGPGGDDVRGARREPRLHRRRLHHRPQGGVAQLRRRRARLGTAGADAALLPRTSARRLHPGGTGGGLGRAGGRVWKFIVRPDRGGRHAGRRRRTLFRMRKNLGQGCHARSRSCAPVRRRSRLRVVPIATWPRRRCSADRNRVRRNGCPLRVSWPADGSPVWWRRW